MDIDFHRLSLDEIASAVRRKEVSAREVTTTALERIEALNPIINAFVAVDGDRALEQAAAVDQILGTGGDPGALAGVPLGVKDLEDAAGYRTTRGSALFADAPPAEHDSVLVARLRAAGCVVVGKTNTPEFGWTSTTANALFGATKNPWRLDHSAGGSSGGSAAALAAGLVPLATGTDGGGSIRIPAACCGLSAMKASLGRVPHGGPEPPGWPLFSTKGPMARRIADVAHALDVVVAPEPTDLRSLPRPEASWRASTDDPHLPTKVLWSPTLGYAPVDREVLAVCERAMAALEASGTEVIEIDTVFDADPVAPWLDYVSACIYRSLEPMAANRGWDRMDHGVAALFDQGREVTGAQVFEVLDLCHRMNLALVELFSRARLLVTPTCAGLAPPLEPGGLGYLNGEADRNWVRFTYPFNMTASPAATVCAGLSESGLPVGLQLVGPQHGDIVVLRSAAAIERILDFSAVAPVG
jgi:aspartyl-tRNA(Asn)/glutamyl-tRNA(Gln) amidotransferase subunit A